MAFRDCWDRLISNFLQSNVDLHKDMQLVAMKGECERTLRTFVDREGGMVFAINVQHQKCGVSIMKPHGIYFCALDLYMEDEYNLVGGRESLYQLAQHIADVLDDEIREKMWTTYRRFFRTAQHYFYSSVAVLTDLVKRTPKPLSVLPDAKTCLYKLLSNRHKVQMTCMCVRVNEYELDRLRSIISNYMRGEDQSMLCNAMQQLREFGGDLFFRWAAGDSGGGGLDRGNEFKPEHVAQYARVASIVALFAQTPEKRRQCARRPEYRCGRCRAVYYCSAECQRHMWPVHKHACSRAAQKQIRETGHAFMVVASKDCRPEFTQRFCLPAATNDIDK